MADERPIIVKKIKKVAAGHHGGAWKVAYADFVTAMMAFFLLLWLLNAVTDAPQALNVVEDGFGYAEAYDEEQGRYRGLVLHEPATTAAGCR